MADIYSGEERRLPHGCVHEKEFGEMQTNIQTLKSELSNLREQNSIIIELSVHLKNLIDEVKEVVDLLKIYGARIDALERAEGDALIALRNKVRTDVWSSIIKVLAVSALSVVIGHYAING